MRLFALVCITLCLGACSAPAPTQISRTITAVRKDAAKVRVEVLKADAGIGTALKEVELIRPAVDRARDFVADGDKAGAERELKVIEEKVTATEGALRTARADLAQAYQTSSQQAETIEALQADFDAYAAKAQKDAAIVKEVQAYWGLGGIWYGIKRLSWRIAVAGLCLAALSFAFPQIPLLGSFSSWIVRAFLRIFRRPVAVDPPPP